MAETVDRFLLMAYQNAAREAALNPLGETMTEEKAAELLQDLVGKVTTLPGRRGVTVPCLNIVTNESYPDYLARIGKVRIREGEDPAAVVDRANRHADRTFGAIDNPKAAKFNRLEPVTEIEAREVSKIVEWDGGALERVTVTEYVARSAPYKMTERNPDGSTRTRTTRDEVTSGPEHFEKDPNTEYVLAYGAATALLARLLEGVTEG